MKAGNICRKSVLCATSVGVDGLCEFCEIDMICSFVCFLFGIDVMQNFLNVCNVLQ